MRTIVAVLAGLAILTPSAQASSADCLPATVVAPVEADAWIDAESPAANKGSDAVLDVGETSRALVRFTQPAGVPDGCVVESARLRLWADSSTEGARVEALPLASGWTESSVSWESQPATTGGAVGAWSREGYVRWNVTALLADAQHGFLIRDAAEGTETAGGHGFYAREKGESPPELVIRYAAPPTGEPAPPAPPEPRSVVCGEVLTESTLVTNDLTDCLGDGLVIGAPRIIVDLGGHTIDGIGLGTGVRNDGYESVAVRDGTVQEFDRAVELLEETRFNVVERLHLHHNEVAAIELFDARDNAILDNAVDNNGGGVLLVSGTRGTHVRGNTFTLNSGAALLLRDANANRLEENRVTGGGDLGVGLERSSDNTLLDTVVADTSDGGIMLLTGSHRNRVEGSQVTQSGDTGILVLESDGNELIANTTLGMSDSGITLNTANDGVVSGNQLSGNPGGLQMDGSSRNLVEANDASNGLGIGIELGGGSFGNTVVFNTANGNLAQGIYVADEALLEPLFEPGNLLQRNTANNNGSDGITVSKGGHTLNANLTLGNRGWGINAIGINSASRNRAEGNGQVGECLGIVCAPPDVTPPETAIDSAPDAFVNATTAVFEFSANEEFASFECALDGAEFTSCSSPRLYLGLAAGEHEFRVRATDESGNVDPTPAVHRWEIDLRPPETTIDAAPAELTGDTTATFAFSADEPSTFECALDGGDFEDCPSPAEYTDLADGSHTLDVRATDKAGNTDPTPATHRWTIDHTPPETTIDGAPAELTSGTGATFEFSADEPATFECALDDAEFGPCTSPQTYTDLAEGEHRISLRATDRIGNTDPSPAAHRWTIDHTPPQTTIDSAPAALTSSTTATFTFSAGEPASFECAVDDAEFEPCMSPVAHTELAEGEHEFRVRAADAADNIDPTPASHRWTIDHTPPQGTIDSAPAALTSATGATFEFSADEPAGFECAFDDAEFGPCTSPQTYTDLAEGEHEFRVRATDAAGNTDPTPATHRWTTDTTPPEATIDTAPAVVTAATSATFRFSADEQATFACAFDDTDFEPCSSPRTYTGLAEGEHEFRVRATDAAGNSALATHGWTIDHTPPQTTIDSAPAALTAGTTATFTFSADEPATFECALDDAEFESCASPQNSTGLAEGEHEFRVRTADAAGNTDPTPASHRWTIDHTPPQTTIDSGPDDLTESTSATFTFVSDDAGATFECSFDGAGFMPCSSPAEYTDLAVGTHTFRVRATDAAGNTDAMPASRTWTIEEPDTTPPDTVAPQTSIGSAPADPSSSASASFIFSSDEPDSSFECSLDGGIFAACSSPAQYTGLADGAHTFRVRATDRAGNTDQTPAAHTWTIDTTPPQTTIGSAPAAQTNNTSATLAFTSSESGSTFECSLDNAAFVACTSPRLHTGLAAGSHNFRVRARDGAGNLDATPATHTWTIDTTVPQTTISSAPPAQTTSTSATFAFTSNEPAATFECSLDNAAFAACTSPRQLTGLPPGSHNFRVRARDGAGNVDASPAAHNWTIAAPQGCAPTLTLTATADSWIDQNSPTANKGSDSILKVQSKGPADNFRALVRFTVPTSLPPGCTLSSATLRVYAASFKPGRTLHALRLASTWTENLVSWSNQPTTSGTAAATTSATGYREWTVTDQVAAMLAPGANHGFLIRDAVEGADSEQQFHSREKGSNVPQLVMRFAGAS